MRNKVKIIDISDWKKAIEKCIGINDVLYGFWNNDYSLSECNFETMFIIHNNKALKLLLKDEKLIVDDSFQTLLPENIQNSYKKWLISKALKVKLSE
jgi:hypothetical protein